MEWTSNLDVRIYHPSRGQSWRNARVLQWKEIRGTFLLSSFLSSSNPTELVRSSSSNVYSHLVVCLMICSKWRFYLHNAYAFLLCLDQTTETRTCAICASIDRSVGRSIDRSIDRICIRIRGVGGGLKVGFYRKPRFVYLWQFIRRAIDIHIKTLRLRWSWIVVREKGHQARTWNLPNGYWVW